MEHTGIYVHVPFCVSRCTYCDFVSCTNLSVRNLYVTALIDEIRARGTKEAVDTVYLGGGTPSTLQEGQLTKILDALKGAFQLLPGAEITVEANPDSCSLPFLTECRAAGVNRLSLGLQSCNDELLKRINRPHTYAQFLKAFSLARESGFNNISVDLMLGLPGDTLTGYRKTLNTVLSLLPEHLSVYALKVEEGTPLCESGFLPDEDLQADMYDLTVALAKEAGLFRYEVSNFCREGYESRHNQKYWRRVPYFGFGAAAHSFDGKFRSENTSNISAYLSGKKEQERIAVSTAEAIEETIMLALRTREGLNFDVLKRNFDYDILTEKKAEFESLFAQKLLIKTQNGVKLAENAYYIMNTIILNLL